MRQIFTKTKSNLRQIRHSRVRAGIAGTALKPRLSVFRGLKSIVAQLIDDETGKTLCYADSKEVTEKKAEKLEAKVADGYLVGKLLAEKAKEKGITNVVFDRGGYKFHGRIKALADGAREGGLVF